jgi:hypothetical protein
VISQPELQGVKRITVPSQAPADVEQPPPVPPVPKQEPQQKVGTSDARKPLKTKPKAAPSIAEGSEYLTFCHVSFLNNHLSVALKRSSQNHFALQLQSTTLK